MKTARCRCTFRYVSNFTTTSWLFVRKRERGRIPGAAQVFWLPPIISGTGKPTNFKFGRYIHRVHPNKSPLKILEKKKRRRIRGLPKFFQYPLLSQERVKLQTSNFVRTFLVSIGTKALYKFDWIDWLICLVICFEPVWCTGATFHCIKSRKHISTDLNERYCGRKKITSMLILAWHFMATTSTGSTWRSRTVVYLHYSTICRSRVVVFLVLTVFLFSQSFLTALIT